LRIQFALFGRIREAARAYQAAPAEASSALANYVTALESLAEYVSARWRGLRLQEAPVKHPPIRADRTSRIIAIAQPTDGSGDATPLTAA
jgi:hypothetical protein